MKFFLITALLGLGATTALAAQSCKTFCQNTNHPDDCSAQAENSTGPCYECGPNAPSDTQEKLCDGVCINFKTDTANCGKCENQCEVGQICHNGICGCRSGSIYCPEIQGCAGRNYYRQLGECGCTGNNCP